MVSKFTPRPPKANRKPRDPRLMRALGYQGYAAKLAGQGDRGWEHYDKLATRLYEEVRRDRERRKARETLKGKKEGL
jgi:hypothetical protein